MLKQNIILYRIISNGKYFGINYSNSITVSVYGFSFGSVVSG